MLDIIRFSIQHPQLKPWIKFIWYLETKSKVSINNKLLPTDSIDVILNLSGPIKYQFVNQQIAAPNYHFNAMHNKYGLVSQQGKLKVFGISFYPFGLYPFIQAPMPQFNNQIVDLKSASDSLFEKFIHLLTSESNIDENVSFIEAALCSSLMLTDSDKEILPILQAFYCNVQTVLISDFCLENHIGLKTFERACLKYTGVSPKTLQRLARFQSASNQLIYTPEAGSLTDLAFTNDYYDQSHFNKEFKDFSGASPCRFMKERSTVKENTKYTYL